MGWIVIRNWDRFQHYNDRDPPWIKLYTRLLHDDNFQSLSSTDRSALVGLWMIYALTGRRVREDTSKISRALGQRVTKGTLERLNHAGFLDISASTPLAQRQRERQNPLYPLTEQPVDNSPTAASRIEAMIRNGVVTDSIDLDAELAAAKLTDELEERLHGLLRTI